MDLISAPKKFINGAKSILQKTWSSTIGPIDPNNERFNIRTRFKLALLSFFILSSVFLISFHSAISTTDNDRTQLLLEFAQHISYVLGAVVASYVGMESVFPSLGGYGWRGRTSTHSGRQHTEEDPPVGPKEDDLDQQ